MTQPDHAEKQVFKVQIDAPIERVWAELVNTTTPRPFFWNGTWDSPEFAPGNPYRISANGGKIVPVIGRVLEMEPPHKLVTSFRLTNLPDAASTVTYLLTEKAGGTEFSLVTEHVAAGSKSEKAMARGSRFIVENFKAYVETGRVTPGARALLALYALTAPLAPRSMSTANWPFEKAE
jgi:uncharacterized protein YndB with AHSA1/START domain